MAVICEGCGLLIPAGRKFCSSCAKYVVKCEGCGREFHERFLYEWRTRERSSTRWVCARCLAKLRDEAAQVGDQVAALGAAVKEPASYQAGDLRRLLHGVDPTAFTNFVRKAKMDNVIRLDASTGMIHVEAASGRDREELSRRFEVWLRGNEPGPPDQA